MKKMFLFLAFSLISILSLPIGQIGCNTAEPPQSNAALNLAVEDVSCTEAWLKIETENLQLPAQINIITTDPNGNTISKISNLTTQDSILYIDSLLPNKTYSFQSVIHPINQSEIKSNVVTATTLDTTSHNFTWQTFTFGGEAGSSYLNDVAIIDENNIYAVGAIYLKDSLGNPDPNAYNVAHWDGSKWELKRLEFFTVCGQSNRSSYPAKAIFAFNENEIWIAMDGDQLIKLEKGIQTKTICLPWSFVINKIWGTSSDDFYIVGNGGNIAHYNGTSWQKIESGTELNINDIYGAYNEKTDEYEILAVASNVLESFEKEIIKIKNTGYTELLSKKGINSTLSGVWFKPNIKYYAVGAGIHFKEMLNNPKWKSYLPGEVSSYYSYGIKANGLNDIAVAGGVGEVLHFNGVSWKSYFAQTKLGYGNYYSLAIKENIIIAVGQDSPQAVILIGRR